MTEFSRRGFLRAAVITAVGTVVVPAIPLTAETVDRVWGETPTLTVSALEKVNARRVVQKIIDDVELIYSDHQMMPATFCTCRSIHDQLNSTLLSYKNLSAIADFEAYADERNNTPDTLDNRYDVYSDVFLRVKHERNSLVHLQFSFYSRHGGVA